jgi:hypothetical protein
MKTICILSCVLLVGILDSVKAAPLTKSSIQRFAEFSMDGYTDQDNEEDSYLPGTGSTKEDFTVDKKKKKKKKKKSHAS